MRTNDGFSLIEVIVAMVVLSVATLSLANLQIIAIRINSSANKLTQGVTLAEDKIEEYMALPFNDPNLNDTGDFIPCNDPITPQGYNVQCRVNTNVDGTKTVDINVAWSNIGNQKSFSLSFIKSNLQ